MGGWWRWVLVSPDGMAPSRMVSVSASVNLPLHHKVQKFSSGTVSPGWSRKKGRKTVVIWWWWMSVVMATLYSNGQAIMFCCSNLFFCTLIFEAEERRPAVPLPGCRNVVKFYNADQREPCLYPVYFEGRKSANFTPQLGDGVTFNS